MTEQPRKEKISVKSEEMGSLEEALGSNDSLFQPEPTDQPVTNLEILEMKHSLNKAASEQPTKPPPTPIDKNTLNIKPETKAGKQDNAGQHLQESLCRETEPEQPNQYIMTVKTIQSLMSVVNDNLGKLNENTKFLSCRRNSLVLKALEEIDLFERTTLFELQKAFE